MIFHTDLQSRSYPTINFHIDSLQGKIFDQLLLLQAEGFYSYVIMPNIVHNLSVKVIKYTFKIRYGLRSINYHQSIIQAHEAPITHTQCCIPQNISTPSIVLSLRQAPTDHPHLHSPTFLAIRSLRLGKVLSRQAHSSDSGT